jgi:transposase
VHVEGVPFARDGARFTRDFEDLVAWLMTKTDRTAVCRLVRIDWETVGRIIKRVGDELLPADRLSDLFEISLDEVAWRKGHRNLTLVGDHREGCVVWGTEGKGQAAADEFFAATRRQRRPDRRASRQSPRSWSRSVRARPSSPARASPAVGSRPRSSSTRDSSRAPRG